MNTTTSGTLLGATVVASVMGVAAPALAAEPAGAQLASTGFDLLPWIIGAAILAVAGVAIAYFGRRREADAAEEIADAKRGDLPEGTPEEPTS